MEAMIDRIPFDKSYLVTPDPKLKRGKDAMEKSVPASKLRVTTGGPTQATAMHRV